MHTAALPDHHSTEWTGPSVRHDTRVDSTPGDLVPADEVDELPEEFRAPPPVAHAQVLVERLQFRL